MQSGYKLPGVNPETHWSPHTGWLWCPDSGQPWDHTVCVPAGGSLDANRTELHQEHSMISLAREEQEF